MYYPAISGRCNFNQIRMKILAFGIAKDIVGGPTVDIAVADGISVLELKKLVLNDYPAFEKLTALSIAVNNEYADDTQVISREDEVVLIPPVSGG